MAGLFSCKNAEDTSVNMYEKTIEKATGVQIDGIENLELANNSGSVVFKAEAKTYLTGKEKMQGSVTINKDKDGLSFAMQFSAENGKSFLAMISKIPDDFSLPITGKFSVSNAHDGINPVATIIFMNVSENGVLPNKIPFEGDLVITQLTKEKVAFEINAKGGESTDTESPSNWVPVTGSGLMENPVIMSYGIDKNKVIK